MATNMTLTKSGITVTVYDSEVNDNFVKKLFIITPAQTEDNQGGGPKPPRIVDLLRITHQMIIKGNILGTGSKSAIQVKHDLVNIWKGANAAGGTVTLTYDANASAKGNISSTETTTITGYVERINFKDVAADEPDDFVSAKENYQDIVKFEVAITFIEGVQV